MQAGMRSLNRFGSCLRVAGRAEQRSPPGSISGDGQQPSTLAMRDLRATRYLAISTRKAMPLDLRRRMDREGAARSASNFDDRMIRGRTIAA